MKFDNQRGEKTEFTFVDSIKAGFKTKGQAEQEHKENSGVILPGRIGQEGFKVKLEKGGEIVFENGAEALDWVHSNGGVFRREDGKLAYGREWSDIEAELPEK